MNSKRDTLLLRTGELRKGTVEQRRGQREGEDSLRSKAITGREVLTSGCSLLARRP